MASPTQWTWVWVNSRSWWWTGRPGMLPSLGPQRVRHHSATELTDWSKACSLKPKRRRGQASKAKRLSDNSLHPYCSQIPWTKLWLNSHPDSKGRVVRLNVHPGDSVLFCSLSPWGRITGSQNFYPFPKLTRPPHPHGVCQCRPCQWETFFPAGSGCCQKTLVMGLESRTHPPATRIPSVESQTWQCGKHNPYWWIMQSCLPLPTGIMSEEVS